MGVPTPAVTTPSAVPVFFLSDSTGISAETMGNALLIQFPDVRFERRLIPFITTVEEARTVVAVLDAAMDGPVTPLAFSTTAVTEIRDELHQSRCPLIDFFDLHMTRVESILGQQGQRVAARLHGVGDVQRYNARMAAVEYAIEHDDGQSMRAMDKADVILVAPSRCGKTPTTMYLALQHGIFVANYPLVEEDFDDQRAAQADQAPARPLFRDHHDGGSTQSGAPRAAAELPLRLAGAVHVRAASGRGALPDPQDPVDQLLGQVRRGDVHRDPPDPPPALRIHLTLPTTDPCQPVREDFRMTTATPDAATNTTNVRWFSELGLADLEQVGGKNSSLGEMVANLSAAGVKVPDGFATTADAFRRFISQTGLGDLINARLKGLDTDDVDELARVGKEIRTAVIEQPFPADLEADIRSAYEKLAGDNAEASFAVRSSARRRRICRTRRSPVSRRRS